MLQPAKYKINLISVPKTNQRDNVGMGIRVYMTIRWGSWAEETQKIYVRAANSIATAGLWGRTMTRLSVPDMDSLQALPPGLASQAIRFLKAVTSHSFKMGFIQKDPLLHYHAHTTPTNGWEEWTDGDLARVCEDVPTAQLIKFAAYSGQRIGDLVRITPQNFAVYGRVQIIQHKTGRHVTLPLTPAMKKLGLVKDALNLIQKANGATNFDNSPIFMFETERQAKHWYYHWCKIWGIKKPFHGLRKYCAIKMAEAGCTMPEIMAVTGHTSTNTAMKYIKAADRFILAKRAAARVEDYENA